MCCIGCNISNLFISFLVKVVAMLFCTRCFILWFTPNSHWHKHFNFVCFYIFPHTNTHTHLCRQSCMSLVLLHILVIISSIVVCKQHQCKEFCFTEMPNHFLLKYHFNSLVCNFSLLFFSFCLSSPRKRIIYHEIVLQWMTLDFNKD